MKIFITLDRLRNKIFSLIFWIVIWEFFSKKINNPILLPSPYQVFVSLIKLFKTKTFWTSIFKSTTSIGMGFFISILIGIILAIISYFIPALKEILELAINIIQATPIASITIILLIWISSSNLSLLIVFFISLPNIYFASLAGLEAVDKKLLEVASVFQARKCNIFKYLYWDKIMEFLTPNIIVTSGLAWKSGVSAEILGLVKNSIGENIYYSKLYLNTSELLAWTFSIIVLSKLFQQLVNNLIKEVG